MNNPYESPKTNVEDSQRKRPVVFLAALLFGGLFLIGSLSFLLLSRPVPSPSVVPVAAPAQQPQQAELEAEEN